MNSGTRKILRQYAREKQILIRNSKDISPLEEWLILELNKLNEYRKILECQIEERRKIDILNSVKKAVCEVKGITEEEFAFKSREGRYTEPKQLFCYIAKRDGITIKNIADFINQHHTSVLYSRIRAENMIETETKSREDYLAVMKILENGFNFRINVDNN